MKNSQQWKYAEHQIAEILKAAGIPAFRKSRGADWSQKDYEVHVEGIPFLKVDSKYSQAKPFRHHGLVREIDYKYCKEKEDQPVLFTKNYKERSGFITIRAEFFAEILFEYLKNKGLL